MSNSESKIPTLFWVIAGLAVVWNLMGLFMFYSEMTMSAETMAALPEGQRLIYENNPIWMKAAYGIATIAGVLGSIALLLRKSWAVPVLLASFIAVIIQMGYSLLGTNVIELMGPSIIAMPVVVCAIAFYLWYYAKKSVANGILS